MSLEEFDGFSDIFVTHGHFDHIVNLPEIVRRNPAVVIHCTQTPYHTLRKKGVPEKNLALLSFGQTLEVQGFCIRTYHGKHAELPKVSPSLVKRIFCSPALGNLPYALRENRLCPENEETVFYQIAAEGRTIALMGSLNLWEEVVYPTGMDLLILPYNGWTDNYPPAMRVIERLQPQRVVLDHYDDTFPPLTAPLDLTPILQHENVQALTLRQSITV